MNKTVRILVLSFFAMTLSQVTGCAGGRQKQAVAVQPAPGSNNSTTDDQQQQNPGSEGPAVGPQTDDTQNQNATGEKTDLQIDTELDNGDGSTTPGSTVSPSGPWDGKSFKGSGKWKVTPVN